MRLEIRKRFIDSIECLQKWIFFQDYPNLSSGVILNKIFSGWIAYTCWWKKWKEDHPAPLCGLVLRESIEIDEDTVLFRLKGQ